MIYICNVIKNKTTIKNRAATYKRLKIMLTKENYRKAQVYAGLFETCGASKEGYSASGHYLDWALEDLMKLDCFAAQVAKTIYDGIQKYHTPRVSSKQAWILAVACVENGFNY